MGRGASDSSAGLGSDVGPDETLMGSLRLHYEQEGCVLVETVSHGTFGLKKDKLQIKEKDRSAHLPVFVHPFAVGAILKSCRSEEARRHRRQRENERRNRLKKL